MDWIWFMMIRQNDFKFPFHILIGMMLAMTVSFALLAETSKDEALGYLQNPFKPNNFEATWVLDRGDVRHRFKWQRIELQNGQSYESVESAGKLKARVHRWQKHVYCHGKSRMLEKLMLRFYMQPFPVPNDAIKALYDITLIEPEGEQAFRKMGLRFSPKNSDRSEHLFWLDDRGMVVGYQKISHKGKTLKSLKLVAFKMWENAPPRLVRQLTRPSGADKWHDIKAKQSKLEPKWSFGYLPEGFALKKRMLRQRKREKEHWVFSDGLSRFSVFFVRGPHAGQHKKRSKWFWGTHYWRGMIGDTKVVVVGDLPKDTIERIVDGIKSTQ